MKKTPEKLDIKDLFSQESQYNIEVELPFSKQTLKMREMVTADQKTFLKNAVQLGDQEFIQRKIGEDFQDALRLFKGILESLL